MYKKKKNISAYTCQTANRQMIPMTPALPSVEHPLAGGGMSSTSSADLLSTVTFCISDKHEPFLQIFEVSCRNTLQNVVFNISGH